MGRGGRCFSVDFVKVMGVRIRGGGLYFRQYFCLCVVI